MAIKDPYIVEQENRQPEASPPTLAVVGEVDHENGGLTLIFPGADGASSKRYQCNTAAVSYTHLDVYKRQEKNSMRSSNSKELLPAR